MKLNAKFVGEKKEGKEISGNMLNLRPHTKKRDIMRINAH